MNDVDTLSVTVECDADAAIADIQALQREVKDLNAELEYLDTLLNGLGSDDADDADGSDDDVEAAVSRGLRHGLRRSRSNLNL